MHQGSVLSPLLFAAVVDVVTEMGREGVVSELLHADDLVLMNETIKIFRIWKDPFMSKGKRANFEENKVMVSGGTTKDGLSRSKVDPCWACKLRIKANLILCIQYCMWVQSKFAVENR